MSINLYCFLLLINLVDFLALLLIFSDLFDRFLLILRSFSKNFMDYQCFSGLLLQAAAGCCCRLLLRAPAEGCCCCRQLAAEQAAGCCGSLLGRLLGRLLQTASCCCRLQAAPARILGTIALGGGPRPLPPDHICPALLPGTSHCICQSPCAAARWLMRLPIDCRSAHGSSAPIVAKMGNLVPAFLCRAAAFTTSGCRSWSHVDGRGAMGQPVVPGKLACAAQAGSNMILRRS